MLTEAVESPALEILNTQVDKAPEHPDLTRKFTLGVDQVASRSYCQSELF